MEKANPADSDTDSGDVERPSPDEKVCIDYLMSDVPLRFFSNVS